jgi:hypothetical protein
MKTLDEQIKEAEKDLETCKYLLEINKPDMLLISMKRSNEEKLRILLEKRNKEV